MGEEKIIRLQFQRFEIKYLPSVSQAHRILTALTPYIRPDPFGETRIFNIYLDTPDRELIRRSIEQPTYKEKLRLRRYGPDQPDSTLFLEIKKKYRGVVYKRRMALTHGQANAFLSEGALPPERSRTAEELRSFLNRYPLMPSAHLSYNRTAYFAKDDPSLRITFDTEIAARFRGASLAEMPDDFPLLPPDTVLMEIKTGGAVPLWLTRVLSREALYKDSFSKYGNAYALWMRENARSFLQTEVSYV